MLTFSRFREDGVGSRAALHDGLILSWDTGLVKTWAMFLWSLLKCSFITVVDAALGRVLKPKAPVLIVRPATKAIIFDLDSCLAAANEVGEQLWQRSRSLEAEKTKLPRPHG